MNASKGKTRKGGHQGRGQANIRHTQQEEEEVHWAEKVGSRAMTQRVVPLPRAERRSMVMSGIVHQEGTADRPGMPTNKKLGATEVLSGLTGWGMLT